MESPCTVAQKLLDPALVLVRDYCRGARNTAEGFGDERYVELGLRRALDGDESGRAFLQILADTEKPIARSTWFDALQSKRRLGVVQDVATLSYQKFRQQLGRRDWLEQLPELTGRAVIAVDGHQIEHACHSQRDSKGRQVASGVLYGLCLHSGLMRPMSRFQGDGQRAHEWRIFKRDWKKWLEADERGGLPIIVADPAYIDIQYWFLEKRAGTAVFISREKENMKPTRFGYHAFDRSDPVNQGVLSDGPAGYTSAVIRRIEYEDPQSKDRFVFITNDTSLRPGVIALLYFMRWKIEKCFDVYKNKLQAKKAWATGEVAAMQQAHFMALLHNLLTCLLEKLDTSSGIRELKVQERHVKKPSAVPSHRMLRYAHAITCQFIRLVRNLLPGKTPWEAALPLFRQRLECYL